MKRPNPERARELAVRYLDRALSADEIAELDQLICSDEACLAAAEAVLAQSFELSRLASDETQAMQQAARQFDDRRSRTSARSAWSMVWKPLAVAASVALAIGLWKMPSPAEPAVAELLLLQGQAQLGPTDASTLMQVIPKDHRVPLVTGQKLILQGAQSHAQVAFPDGTEALLSDPSELTLRVVAGQKILDLKRGQIALDVTPQKSGRPLIVQTPSGRAEVLGTELEIAATDAVTDLTVTHGLVAMVRDADGARVDVAAGQQVRVDSTSGKPLYVSEIPPLPDTWGEDFSVPPDDSWGSGKWQPDGTMLAYPRFDLGWSHFAVSSSNAWQEGHHAHFQVHSDSVLKLRFKMERPQWFVIRLGLRATPESTLNLGGNAFYQNSSWHRDLQPDEWRTLTIPLTDVHHFSRSSAGEVDLEGLGAYLVSVSTQRQDAGLVIDEIRVLRTRSGAE